jgi:hypothetical protein
MDGLKSLTLKGYLLVELVHLPASLSELDLSACRVSYETAVCLPSLLSLKSLALPSGGGRFCFGPKRALAATE